MPSSAVMRKFKSGTLKSGGPNGPTVRNRRQAVAIMMSERKNEAAHGGKYVERPRKMSSNVKHKKVR